MNYNQQYGQFNNPFNNITPEQKKTIKRVVIAVVIVIIALIIGTTSWYTVEEKQMGVVTTFGKVTKTTEAGFHLKLPFGIQKVYKVDVNVHQKIEIGYVYDENTGEYKTLGNESKMITGDFNIVNIDFFVEYKIYDPVKYLFSSINPEGILKSIIQIQIRTVVSA